MQRPRWAGTLLLLVSLATRNLALENALQPLQPLHLPLELAQHTQQTRASSGPIHTQSTVINSFVEESDSEQLADCWVITAYYPVLMCQQPKQQKDCTLETGAFKSQQECCEPTSVYDGCTPWSKARGAAPGAYQAVPVPLLNQVQQEALASVQYDPQDVDPGGIPPAPTTPSIAATVGAPLALDDLLDADTWVSLFPWANLHSEPKLYHYAALMEAAKSFPDFANSHDHASRLRELAAFLAHCSEETSGWEVGQPFIWGLVFNREQGCAELPNACVEYNDCYGHWGTRYPCSKGQFYYGRGPLMIRHNPFYGQASRVLFGDDRLLLHPELVASDPTTAWQVALWQWMTPMTDRMSAHQAMTRATPAAHGILTSSASASASSSSSYASASSSGFGLSINILAGSTECGRKSIRAENRVNYYLRYCAAFNVSAGEHLECVHDSPMDYPLGLQQEGEVSLPKERPQGVTAGDIGFLIPEDVPEAASATATLLPLRKGDTKKSEGKKKHKKIEGATLLPLRKGDAKKSEGRKEHKKSLEKQQPGVKKGGG